jgi:hypothetical protein
VSMITLNLKILTLDSFFAIALFNRVLNCSAEMSPCKTGTQM